MTTTLPKPKPPSYCMNCMKTVYETPEEHMATCPKQPFKYEKNGMPELIPMPIPGDEPDF